MFTRKAVGPGGMASALHELLACTAGRRFRVSFAALPLCGRTYSSSAGTARSPALLGGVPGVNRARGTHERCMRACLLACARAVVCSCAQNIMEKCSGPSFNKNTRIKGMHSVRSVTERKRT